MEEPPAPLRKVFPAQVGVRAEIANISHCVRTVNTAMPFARGWDLPGDPVMAREVTEELLARLWLWSRSCWDEGPSWKVRFGAVRSLQRPRVVSHGAVCWEGTVAMPGPAGELCPFASPAAAGTDPGSAALTLLHPCHGTCDWREVMPRRGHSASQQVLE